MVEILSPVKIQEKAILVVIDWHNSPTNFNLEEIINELINLTYTAGIEVVDIIT